MSELNVGIVGAGLAGRLHAKILEDVSSAQVVGVYNRSEAAGRQLAEKYDAEYHGNYSELLDQVDLDVVSICTPNSLHKQFALPAAEGGTDLVVEKPLEVNTEKCRDIVEAARNFQVKLAVIFQNRFTDVAQALKKAVEEERFGTIVHADASIKWFRPAQYYREGWQSDPELAGGGALMTQGIHTIDLMQWMMPEVEEIWGRVRTLHHDVEVEDMAVANLTFTNGATGIIQASTAIYPGVDERLGIYGTEGTVELAGNRVETWKFEDERKEDEEYRSLGAGDTSGGASDPSGISPEYHSRQFEQIVRDFQREKDHSVDGIEGTKSVEIIEAIYESSRVGRPVTLT